MINEKIPLLKIEINKKTSALENCYRNFIEGLYALFSFMLEDPIENFWYECISISLGYFQLLIYIIDETVSHIIITVINKV